MKKYKKLLLFSVLILFFINFLASIPVNANTTGIGGIGGIKIPDFSSDDEDLKNNIDIDDKFQGQSPLERMAAKFITALAQSIYEILGIKDPLVLIFDYEPMFNLIGEHHTRDELWLGVFTDGECEVVNAFYDTFEGFIPIWMVLTIVLIGLLLVFAGFGGNAVLTAKQYLSGIVVAVFILMFGPNLMGAVFDISYFFIDIVKNLIENFAYRAGIEVPKSLLGIMASGFMQNPVQADSLIGLLSQVTGIGYAIIIFMVFINAGVLNFQYIIRKLTLGILILMFPVVAFLAVFPNTRGGLKIWLSEFFANVTLPAAHAVVYGFLTMLSLVNGETFSLLEILIFTAGLNGIIGLVRSLFGAPQIGGRFSGIGTMMGLGGIYGIGKVIKGMTGRDAPGIVSELLNSAKTSPNTITTAEKVAPGSRDIEKIAGMGKDFTPSQAGLVRAQLEGNLTPIQTAELEGPQREISIKPQREETISLKRKLGRIGGAAVIGSMGALAGGLMTGNSRLGIPAIVAGKKTADWSMNTMKNLRNLRSNKFAYGIYDSNQFFDSKSAVQIGKNIAGVPGAVTGWTVGKAYSFYDHYKTGGEKGNEAKKLREQIDDTYMKAYEEYNRAERKLQLANYDYNQLDILFPAEMRNNPDYNLKKQDMITKIEEAKRELEVKRLRFKEIENIKKNEHDYIGLHLKMKRLQRNMRTGGGIGEERGSI